MGVKVRYPTCPSHQPSGTVKPSKNPKNGNLEKETSSPFLSFESKGFPGSKIPSSISQFTVVESLGQDPENRFWLDFVKGLYP